MNQPQEALHAMCDIATEGWRAARDLGTELLAVRARESAAEKRASAAESRATPWLDEADVREALEHVRRMPGMRARLGDPVKLAALVGEDPRHLLTILVKVAAVKTPIPVGELLDGGVQGSGETGFRATGRPGEYVKER